MDCARRAFAAGLASAARGARRRSTRNWFATVMARSGDGSWNGNLMSAFLRTVGVSSAYGCHACPSIASCAGNFDEARNSFPSERVPVAEGLSREL